MKPKRSKNKSPTKTAPRKSSDLSVRGAPSSRDGALLKGKTEGKKKRYMRPYWATLSSASHTIHPSILAARVSSTSSPSTNLPTPDSSRKRNKRLSQRGLLRSTRILPGSLPSHASARAARKLSIVQCSKVWDLVIFRSWQNQHWSSPRFLIRLKYTAERQWPILIWAAVLAMEFLVRSMHDFFGGGGGISSAPWCVGSVGVPFVFGLPELL